MLILLFIFSIIYEAKAQRRPPPPENDECIHKYIADTRGTLLNDVWWGPFSFEESRVVLNDERVSFGKLELLGSGFRWTEGPLWSKKRKTLYFTDTIDQVIYTWNEYDGIQIVAIESGGDTISDEYFERGANGLSWFDKQETAILVCQHGSRRVVKIDVGTMKITQIMAKETPRNRSLNSPNDVIVYDNSILFTDPPYGLLLKDDDSRFALNTPKGLPADQPYVEKLVREIGAGVHAVYRVDMSSGQITELTSALNRPNGLAVIDDSLWVANSALHNGSWTAFNLTTGNIIRHFPYPTNLVMGRGVVDGFIFDPNTRLLWSSAPGGIIAIDIDQARPVAAYRLGVPVSNLAFDDTRSFLYVTGEGHLWRIRIFS